MNKQNDELMHIALVVTDAGKEAERQALLVGKKIKLTHVIVDSVLLPEAADPKKLTAVQQCPRDQNGELAKYLVGGESKNDQLLIAWSLPVESGDYMINGLGFWLEDGTLYAYQRVVIGYKPNPNTGALFEPRGIALQEISDESAITFNIHLDDIYATLEDIRFLISQIPHATTTEKGLIELATSPEVATGSDSLRAVTPATLKPIIDNLQQLISNSESALNQPATTTRMGLVELATLAEVDNKTGKNQVVTVDTLDKPALIATLKAFSVNAANTVKEELFGGLPSATLDTFVEVGDALQQAGDAVATLFRQIAEKLPATTFDEFRLVVLDQIKTLKNYATTDKSGLIELATATEVAAGKDSLRAITSAALKPLIDNLKTEAEKSPDRLLVAEYTGSVISGGLSMNHITTVTGKLSDYKYIEADGYFVEDSAWTDDRKGWSARIPIDSLLKYGECVLIIGAWGSATFTHKVMIKDPTETTFTTWQTANFRIHRIHVTK